MLTIGNYTVFPTRVGMNRPVASTTFDGIRIPHTRGDEPRLKNDAILRIVYSPHAWG